MLCKITCYVDNYNETLRNPNESDNKLIIYSLLFIPTHKENREPLYRHG